MTVSRPPDVWVRDATRNTPAHRVLGPERYLNDDGDQIDLPPVIAIACPPYLAVEGMIIGRQRAATLEVMPCANCFGIDLQTSSSTGRRSTR